jgi:hypothetical protein
VSDHERGLLGASDAEESVEDRIVGTDFDVEVVEVRLSIARPSP